MGLNKYFNITLDDLYWQIKFGRSKRQLSYFDLRDNVGNYIKSPVFFLSTGRCGTKWFSDLLSHHKALMVLHNPTPNLAMQSKLAYQILTKDKLRDIESELLKEIFWVGREQFLRYSYKSEKRYVETNNYITFFTPILTEIFPDAKFVHLYRHPGEFVRSGIRRNYYTEGNSDDIKRIVSQENWDKYNQIEKIAWLWNETNQFIESFKKNYQAEIFDFNFNDLNPDNVLNLCKFLNIDIPSKTITKFLGVKSNIQKKGSFPPYKNWKNSDKNSLIEVCKDLAEQYNYQL